MLVGGLVGDTVWLPSGVANVYWLELTGWCWLASWQCNRWEGHTAMQLNRDLDWMVSGDAS